jgi:hypothetical protein
MAAVGGAGLEVRDLERPRIVVVSWPPALVNTMPGVFTELADRGAELLFAAKRGDRIRIPERLHGQVRGCVLPLRHPRATRAGIELFRFLSDLSWAFTPALDSAPWTRRRSVRRLLDVLEHPDVDELSRRAVDVQLPPDIASALSAALGQVERLLPPIPGLEEALSELDADAVLVLSRCGINGPDRDLIKAARRLGIPSALLVWSWDNLSSKAVLNEHPDRMLVWNQVQAREAVEMHGVPEERISVVGAAKLDSFFEELATHRRQTEDGGSADARILYLASSRAVVKDEAKVVERWLAAIRSADDPRLRRARVVVRPHPGKATRSFEAWEPADEHVSLDDPQSSPLVAALVEADLVVALNTSAELEAGIAGLPVVTLRAGADALGQEGSAHFHYLLEANGGFVRDTHDLDAHVQLLSAILAGDGFDRSELFGSAERFVRPLGITRPVAEIVASELIELAAGRGRGRDSASSARRSLRA